MRNEGPSSTANEFHFHSTIDPEELFRKIFGDLNFRPRMSDFEYADTKFGHGASEEVIFMNVFLYVLYLLVFLRFMNNIF